MRRLRILAGHESAVAGGEYQPTKLRQSMARLGRLQAAAAFPALGALLAAPDMRLGGKQPLWSWRCLGLQTVIWKTTAPAQPAVAGRGWKILVSSQYGWPPTNGAPHMVGLLFSIPSG